MKLKSIIISLLSLAFVFQLAAQENENHKAYSFSTGKMRWTIDIPIKTSVGNHTYQKINVNTNTDLYFFTLNPYYSIISGVEAGFSYSLTKKLYAGFHLGLVGCQFEEYNYRNWEYRNLFMMPAYASLRYDLLQSTNTIFTKLDLGYNFNSQNFYNDLAVISAIERGGLLYAAHIGWERDYFNHRFFLSLGYEVNENNVTIYLENLPLQWVGNAEGIRKFKEYQNTIVLKLGMNI